MMLRFGIPKEESRRGICPTLDPAWKTPKSKASSSARRTDEGVRSHTGKSPYAPSVGQRHQFVFRQEQQFHPPFYREGVHREAVLPEAEAEAEPCGRGAGLCG